MDELVSVAGAERRRRAARPITGARLIRWLDGWLEVEGPVGARRWRVGRESLVLLGGPLRAVDPRCRAFAVALEPGATVLVERRGGRLAVAVVGGSPMSGPAAERRGVSTASGGALGTGGGAAARPAGLRTSLPTAVAAVAAMGAAGAGDPGAESRPAAAAFDAFGRGNAVRPLGVAPSGGGAGAEPCGPVEP
jgi:hypothetical protein